MGNMLYELRDTMMHELKDTMEHGQKDMQTLDTIDKLTHIIKSVDTICAMEDAGYSRDEGYSHSRYGRGNRYSYNDGYGSGYSNNSYRYEPEIHYSHDDGRMSMMHRLEEMMRDAKTDKEREAIKMCMDKLNS